MRLPYWWVVYTPTKVLKLTAECINDVDFKLYVKYDTSSKSCLRAVARYNQNVKEDQELGSIHYKNANHVAGWRIYINGEHYSAHRVVWKLIYGNITVDKVIDHVDGNPLNNKVDNLRLGDITLNNKNRKRMKSNKTGHTGVVYNELKQRGKISRYYTGCYHSKGIEVRKHFSIKKYGEQGALTLAINFRKQGLQDDMSYTERHGND